MSKYGKVLRKYEAKDVVRMKGVLETEIDLLVARVLCLMNMFSVGLLCYRLFCSVVFLNITVAPLG